MTWHLWTEELLRTPRSAVTDLLRGTAEVSPFERVTPHEFLLAVLPRSSRLVPGTLLGEPRTRTEDSRSDSELPAKLDAGLTDWLLDQRSKPSPAARKLGAYVTQLCEALQWPQYFRLPQVRGALRVDRPLWVKWLGGLTLSAYLDPEYEYWRVLAADQADDQMQFFWQSFVVEAGRTRSDRYLNLGLLALAKLPLSDEDSLRNLRLQVQALVSRYQRRKTWGTPALEELARNLRGVLARNPSMSIDGYRNFLVALLAPIGEDRTVSTLSLLGIGGVARRDSTRAADSRFRLKPPGMTEETDHAVDVVRRSSTLAQAWSAVHPLLSAHEEYLRKSGDYYFFVRNLDRCGRALCAKYPLVDQEVRDRLFQWIHLALRVDSDDARQWMLWELALRKAGQPQRAQWVLWEMTRRFPEDVPCRVELARILAVSESSSDQRQAQRLLRQVLLIDPDHLHAYSTIAQLAIRSGDWLGALSSAQKGLQIDPGNEHCAVLLAKAYACRNEPGDPQTAIDHLQRFISRYPGKLFAERSLRNLLDRQRSTDNRTPPAWEDFERPVASEAPLVESNPVWRAFAESIQVSAAPNGAADAGEASVDRVLPLPLGLGQALMREQWDSEMLEQYDAATQQEYPLETRLWRYLQSIRTTEHGSVERRRAGQELQAWMETEERAAGPEAAFWVQYLKKRWTTVAEASEEAVRAGSEWLHELLDRYRPLPAPLLE